MNPFDTDRLTRRDFSARMVLLGAGSLLTALPFSTPALADVALQWGQVPPLDMGRDEALGNYPGYAEAIPSGKAHHFAEAAVTLTDGQFC